MKKTAVMFDLDGTLWDAVDVLVVAWNEIIKKYDGLQAMTRADLEGYMGKTIYEISDIHFSGMEEKKRHAVAEECERNGTAMLTKRGATAYDGVCDVMKELSEKHMIFIVSNCQEGYIDAFLMNHGAKQYVSDYEYSGRTGRPKGENIKMIMERNGITDAVYVGDTEGDRLAAELAEVEFIFASYGFGEVKGAKNIAKNASEIAKIVNEIL